MMGSLVEDMALITPLRMGLKIVAVVGGAVVGGLVCGILFSLVARGFFKQKPPRLMKRFVQLLGAVALGLALWKLPIGFGGGLGFGGGSGLGGQAESGQQEEPNRGDSEQAVQPDTTLTLPEAAVLRIEMLGGERVKDERFYLIEGETKPRTLTEIRKIILDRQKPGAHVLKGIEIVIYQNSVAQNHPAVCDLERWARQHDLAVTLTNK